jgi:hypothetical protein
MNDREVLDKLDGQISTMMRRMLDSRDKKADLTSNSNQWQRIFKAWAEVRARLNRTQDTSTTTGET